ncbi:MAG: DUF4954 family protein [Chitinispirillaceae bacterium]
MIDIKPWLSTNQKCYRKLKTEEISKLHQNRNSASEWGSIHVQEGFKPEKVFDCHFEGEIYIGAFDREHIQNGALRLRTGLYGSQFVDSVIGSNSAVHSLHYCRNQNIGNEVLIFNVGELSCSKDAAYGMSISRKADGSVVKNELELINENGGRAVLAFPGMTCTDAYIWARFRDDDKLMKRLEELTLSSCQTLCPSRGIIADRSSVKDVRCIRDSLLGPRSVVDGAEAIINSTVLSDESEKTSIGTAVQIKNSIIGLGSNIDSATQLVSVITGTAVSVSQSARICHTFIGDNAAIACCEIANCLLLPSHAQHHNNSFLIASMIGGQSNIAAGATIGSNHNSRVNDGELWAGRGFWPGLCTNFKHNSRFASFTMCAKGDYSSELDIRLPFSLLIPDQKTGGFFIFPAFWFTHNMYAVMRSSFKFASRDKRIHKQQFIEHDLLAPDTIEEIFTALELLELWVGKALLTSEKEDLSQKNSQEIINIGKNLLLERPSRCSSLKIMAEKAEKGRFETPLKNSAQAYKLYRTMIRYYGAENVISFLQNSSAKHLEKLLDLQLSPSEKWINCGSMVIPESILSSILEIVKKEAGIGTWKEVHELFDRYVGEYKNMKLHHAITSLARVEGIPAGEMTVDKLKTVLEKSMEDFKTIARLTSNSRAKDFSDPFRSMVYDSPQEMKSVIGTAENDTVVKKTVKKMDNLVSWAESILKEL